MTTDIPGLHYFWIVGCTFMASLLTFFTGFGLATILTPIFVLIFPLEVAIPFVAVVHLVSTVTKFALTSRMVAWSVVLRFGIPAVLFSALGARAFFRLEGFRSPVHIYAWGEGIYAVTLLSLVLGGLLMVFSLIEVIPQLHRLGIRKEWLPLGGALSGFFGGLSGHQGAIRSTFLSKLDLSAAAFVATSAAIALGVDAVRIGLYGIVGVSNFTVHSVLPLGVASVSAVTAIWIGKKNLEAVTIPSLRFAVALAVFLFGAALAAGWIKTGA